MRLKYRLYMGFFALCVGMAVPSHASLYICQKGLCDYAVEDMALKPWIHQLHAFFKTPNARIDFCEADPKQHICLKDSISWVARSPVVDVNFSVPVARTLPQKNTLLMDYLVSANAFLPSCSFSNTTFEEADNHTIRLVSNAFECQLTGVGSTKLQKTFFIDFIDFDNSIIGAQYTIQTHGEISGNATGYAMMKFRDGNTLMPLVPQPYFGEMPAAPDSRTAQHIMKQQQMMNNPEEEENPLITGVQDWWEQLKESLNLDTPRRRTPNEEPHWWNKLTDTFMKVIYLEPLD